MLPNDEVVFFKLHMERTLVHMGYKWLMWYQKQIDFIDLHKSYYTRNYVQNNNKIGYENESVYVLSVSLFYFN